MIVVRNVTRGTVVAQVAQRADSPRARLLGLIGRPLLRDGEALILPRTPWLHTCFMSFPIDVIFYGGSGHVLALVEALRPWRLSPICWRARGAIELPAGILHASGTRPGDLLRIDTAPGAAEDAEHVSHG